MAEVTRALGRKLRIPSATVNEIRAFLTPYSTTAVAETSVAVNVRDPADAIILATAIAAGADVLVTGDTDLLDVRSRVADLQIIDPRGFQALVARPR